MKNAIQEISLGQLAYAFIPVAIVVLILFRWTTGGATALYALSRMLIQLLLIGYVLVFIFETDQNVVVMGVLAMMITLASWISLRTTSERSLVQYLKALAAVAIGGIPVLVIVTQGVLDIDPWYHPSKMIPLAGMIFANSMTSVSLAAERFYAEREKATYLEARSTALSASLIPITNALFAVGLVSLPGMMTGQILSGVEPMIAARYQIMVMCMVYGASGIAAACYLKLLRD